MDRDGLSPEICFDFELQRVVAHFSFGEPNFHIDGIGEQTGFLVPNCVRDLTLEFSHINNRGRTSVKGRNTEVDHGLLC